MNFDRTGFILYTINYEACVTFYEKALELKKMFETDTLTCFEFGGAYLMVEIDDEYDPTQKGEYSRIKNLFTNECFQCKRIGKSLNFKKY